MGSKSKKRCEIMEGLMSAMKTPEVFKTIDYKKKSEDYVKAHLYPYILKSISKIYTDVQSIQTSNAEKKAKKNLLWEGNVHTTVNNMIFMGTAHRPDMVLKFKDNLSIAIEYKLAKTGSNVREGIGQAIIYSTEYDFVALLIIDITPNGSIVLNKNGEKEKNLISSLWDNYNIMMDIV